MSVRSTRIPYSKPTNPLSLKQRYKLLKGYTPEKRKPKEEFKETEVKYKVPLNEMTLKDLRKDASKRFKTRQRANSQKIRAKYMGTDKNGVVYFRTTSGTTPGVFWRQRVELLDLKPALQMQKKDPSMRNRDVVNLAIFGDIRVHCNDPSFTYYGWKYVNWELGSGIEPEYRFPKVRNPRLSGSVCKHLLVVLDVLPFHISEIVRDLRRLGMFGNEPEIDDININRDDWKSNF